MGFRINRGIFQYQDGEEFRNKFKIAEDGRMVEVDAEGNPTTAFLKVGDTATDADTVDGIDSGSFLRSDAANSFTSTITMNTQQAFKPANFGQGVYGRYDSTRYQHLWGMGQSWHMAENGTNLGNFYGLAYTHTNVGGESKSGLSHQTLFVENGVTKTAIGRGIWTDGTITATGNANISGNLDIGGAVVGTSNGVALAVGGTSTYGVYTADNARNQLVVSANYYPHFVIAADLSNNSNHGAVISLVGSDSDGTSKSWGIGISNQNPHLFSIGYNKNSDPNPHYGVGDNWSSDDDNHARLSIDRDGNTKIRGSLYVNGTKGGITTGSKVATEAYASGAAETVNLRIEEEILPAIDTKLDADATAVNASKSSLIQTISSTREGDAAMPSLGYSLQHFLARGPSNNDGHILGMTWTGTSVYGAQIWVDTDPNNKMAFRSRSNAGVWTRWNNLWHDGNLTNVSQLSNDSGYINGESIARFNRGTIDASSSVFTHMRGATSLNNPSGIGGAIKISLPIEASFTNTMMFMTIKVYEYSTSKSFTLYCGGYNYYTQSWYNTFAYIVGAETRGDIPVKFGHDGERNIIWIGNPDWSWSYPNVFISEFNSGHTQNSNWNDGWDISFDEAPAINVTGSHTAYRNITQGNISSQHVQRARDLGAYYTADDWIRATSDNNHVKFYGNSRQMLFRTDGTTETYGGIGGYPFVWTYNGSSSGSRIMILDTDGRLWTDRYGWLDQAFDASGASAIVNDRIETEIIPSITSAQSAANDAQAAADLAVATADTAEARANSAREDAAAAQTTADSKLGATEKATNSHAADGVNMVGYGNNEFSFYQSSGTFAGHTGWANYFIGNHGAGSSYYNTTHIMPFWGPPQYSRLEGGTFRGPYTYWTTENLNPSDYSNASNLSSGTVPYDRTNRVLPTSGNYVWNAATTAGSYDTGVQTSFVRGAQGWPHYGAVLHVGARGGGDAGGDFQLYCGHGSVSGGNHLRFRNADNSASPTDSWTDWKTILDSLNFTSYAEPAGRIDGEVLPQIDTNTTNIARNLTSIDGKAAVSGSYGQNFYVNALYYDDWVRNHSNNNGMYWSNTGWHLYPKSSTDFYVRSGNNTECALQMYTGNTARTYLYADSSNNIGFLTASRSWALRVDNSKNTQIYNNLTVNGGVTAASLSGSLDWANVTNKPTIPAATAPIQALVEGGNESTLASITFSPGEGAATFTLADGQTFRLAFAR